MARATNADKAKLKAQREKKLAIGLSVVLVAVLAIEGPKTMKMLNSKPNAPVVAASAAPTTPAAATPATPVVPAATGAAPATPSSSLVSAVQPSVDPGQLRAFQRFASKDPFKAQVAVAPAGGGSGPVGGTSAPKPASPPAPKVPPAPPAPAPTSAVISLNGELAAVTVDGDFPTSGTVFNHAGAIFHLVSLTKSSAKVTINGGSYASGAPALTLTVGKPVTLQNTADGTRYTLVLEPEGTQVPVQAPPTLPGAPAVTTPSSVVPSTP
jgi:hypothetical protein